MGNMTEQKPKKDNVTTSSLVLGLLSVFLWEFSIIPILAIIFGAIGLARGKNKWQAGIGVALGVIFLIVRINQGYIDRGLIKTSSSDATPQASIVASELPISRLTPIPEAKKDLSIGNVKGSLNPASGTSNLENQTMLLVLTDSLREKYVFLDKVGGVSLSFIKSVYQDQKSSIEHLQQLQNIEYRTDVAKVVTRIQMESIWLLKVIDETYGVQGDARRGIEQLDAITKTFNSKLITEEDRKAINEQTIWVDAWIEIFDPKNPENPMSVVNARNIKITELQEALFRSIQSTR